MENSYFVLTAYDFGSDPPQYLYTSISTRLLHLMPETAQHDWVLFSARWMMTSLRDKKARIADIVWSGRTTTEVVEDEDPPARAPINIRDRADDRPS